MKLVRIGGLVLLAAAVSLGAWAATQAWAAHCGTETTFGSCTENVRNTKHNLALNTDLVGSGTVIGTSEVCVFCHTPHGGRDDVAGGGAPLWNRALPASAGFENYTSPNFDNQQGSEAAGPKGVSLACLSCHDGTIALDALINAPGSGGFDANNRSGASPRSSAAITFTGAGADSTDSLKEGERPSTDAGGGFLGGLNDFVNPGAGAGMAPFPNLGRDLTDDHPISMRMPTAIVDPQFADARNSSSAVGNITPVKRSNTTLPTDKRDQVRLYNTDATNFDWVECASCHNPHTPRTTFLRLPSIPGTGGAVGTERPAYAAGTGRDLNHEPNQGSLICFTCHEK